LKQERAGIELNLQNILLDAGSKVCENRVEGDPETTIGDELSQLLNFELKGWLGSQIRPSVVLCAP
jgi:hypothetical protein